MMRRLIFALLALPLLFSPAEAARQYADITCATTATTGTGTLTLGGASGNYLPFSTQVTDGSTVTYGITSGDGKYETGVGVYTASGTSLTRASSIVSTDGVGTKLTLSGTSVVCVNFLTIWQQPNLGAGDTPTFGSIELGSSGTTDATVTRSAAGEATLETKAVKHAGTQTIPLLAGAGVLPTGGAIASCTNVNAFDSGSNDVFMRQCSFNAGTDNAIYWTIPFPKSAAEGTFTFAVDWTSATTTDATDDVIWTGAAVCFSNDDPINGNAFPTVVNVTDTQTAAGDFLRSATSSAVTPAGTWTEGDVCVFRLTRDADNASDNFNGTADMIDVMLYYTDNASSDD